MADKETPVPATSGDFRFDSATNDIKRQEAELLVRKQADYGSLNIAHSPGGPLNGLAVRLADKVSRLANLAGSQAEPNYESLIDTAIDIANYGTILHMVLAGEWPGTPAYEEQDEFTIDDDHGYDHVRDELDDWLDGTDNKDGWDPEQDPGLNERFRSNPELRFASRPKPSDDDTGTYEWFLRQSRKQAGHAYPDSR